MKSLGDTQQLIGFFSLTVGQRQDIRYHRRDTVRGSSLQGR